MGLNTRVIRGWIPDHPDSRDKLFPIPVGAEENSADIIDLREGFGRFKIEDQGTQGSCAATSTAEAIEFVLAKTLGADSPEVSRSFLYYMARKEQNWQHDDSGSLIRDNFKVAQKYGVCSEFAMPYNDKDYRTCPGLYSMTEAARHKIGRYMRLDGVPGYISCLRAGYPFVFGIYLYENFEDMQGACVRMPQGKSIGGHAMLCCGVNLQSQYFLVRNSWGTSFGDRGFCWIPFAYMAGSDLKDSWTLREVGA